MLSGCALPGFSSPPASAVAQAAPAAALPGWWTLLHDPAIDTLAQAALADSPTLAQALARIDEARATLGSADAQRLPTVGASAGLAAGSGHQLLDPRGLPLEELDVEERVGTDPLEPDPALALQIAAYEQAIDLTEAAQAGELDEAAWREALATLRVLQPHPIPTIHNLPGIAQTVEQRCTDLAYHMAETLALIKAYEACSAPRLQPYGYTLVLWAIAVGLVVLGEFPDAWTILGAAIIVGAGVFALLRERALAARDVPRTSPEPV